MELLKFYFPFINITMLVSFVSGNGLSKENITLAEAGKNMPLAIVSSEDQNFATHYGFDFEAIQDAIEDYGDSTKVLRGGSTLSQQTAKNVFLWQGRDWIRKAIEVPETFLIEWIWGKKRILEIYLNIAETGKGFFGVEAAAKHYFQKSAKELSVSEAAWIATILPNPKKLDIKKPTKKMIRKHNWIMKQMQNLRSNKEIVLLLEHEKISK